MRVYYSERHAAHAPKSMLIRGRLGPCPETPERATILLDAATAAGHNVFGTQAFSADAIRRVHDPKHYDFLEQAWAMWSELPDHGEEIIANVHPGRNMNGQPKSILGLAGRHQADTACPIGIGTWEAVRASADTALSAANVVMEDLDKGDKTPFAYALARPPGHHAFADQAGGFCYLNNTAIATQYCRDQGARRVAIIDVDVHHGNGTQGIFYSRNDVLTVSLHGDPAQFYPFYAGYSHETGSGAGLGYNVNHPLPYGTTDDTYLGELDRALENVMRFKPDVLVVALGLDASEHDGHQPFLSVTTLGFTGIGRRLGEAGLPTVLIQEGGYVSDYLGANLAAVLSGFEQSR
jgi:acetoin utilization deacetylase AcuC-like enzyme